MFYKNRLVGGLYGITIGNIFCGESMFSIEKNASKISMVYLAAHLIEERDLNLLILSFILAT